MSEDMHITQAERDFLRRVCVVYGGPLPLPPDAWGEVAKAARAVLAETKVPSRSESSGLTDARETGLASGTALHGTTPQDDSVTRPKREGA